MNETMARINQMSKERQVLWSKASHGGLSVSEINRIKELTDTLYTTWDQYRREYAGAHSHRNLAFINFNQNRAA